MTTRPLYLLPLALFALVLTAGFQEADARKYPRLPKHGPVPVFRSDVAGIEEADNAPNNRTSTDLNNVRPDSLDRGTIPSILTALRHSRNASRSCQRDFAANTRAKDPRPSPFLKKDLNDYVRAGLSAGISESQMRQSMAAYLKNQTLLKNQRYLTIIDYSKRSNKKRMHILDLKTGKIDSVHTAHGKGSDPRGSGRGQKFSNQGGSKASSLGCMVTGGFYQGSKGKSLRLHGLEVGKNDRACSRAVVMHGASYVGGTPGRSWGCPALRHADRNRVYDKIGGGALVCAFNGDQK